MPAAAHVYLYRRSQLSERIDDCERCRDGQRQEQPDELDLAEPLGAEEPRPDEVLRQPLHQEQADPTEHPDGG